MWYREEKYAFHPVMHKGIEEKAENWEISG